MLSARTSLGRRPRPRGSPLRRDLGNHAVLIVEGDDGRKVLVDRHRREIGHVGELSAPAQPAEEGVEVAGRVALRLAARLTFDEIQRPFPKREIEHARRIVGGLYQGSLVAYAYDEAGGQYVVLHTGGTLTAIPTRERDLELGREIRARSHLAESPGQERQRIAWQLEDTRELDRGRELLNLAPRGHLTRDEAMTLSFYSPLRQLASSRLPSDASDSRVEFPRASQVGFANATRLVYCAAIRSLATLYAIHCLKPISQDFPLLSVL